MRALYLIPLVAACVAIPTPPQWDGAVQSLALSCLDRHDAYHAEDQAALADSTMARMLMPDPAARPFVLACLDRHDAAVTADPALTELERTSFLASSALLRDYATL